MTDAIVTELRPSIPSPVSPGEGRPSKDRTNAARQRRYRAKRAATREAAAKPPAEGFAAASPIAKQAVAVTPASASPAVTSLRNGGADVAAYLAALALARAAAWFSVRGMVVLFPGSPLSVVGMSCAMEAAKLVTAGWLARRWRATAWLWRLVLVALVAGLAVINATGVYAQLVAAHVRSRGA